MHAILSIVEIILDTIFLLFDRVIVFSVESITKAIERNHKFEPYFFN